MIVMSEAEAREYCATLTDSTGLARLDRLAEMLLEENRRQNLIAKASESALWQRHLADSAQLVAFVPRETSPWLDLGTGAGLPGLIVAALRPQTPCILIESRRKRAEWLARAAGELGLRECRVEGARLETIPSLPAAVISARAFAPLPKMIALSARFSTRDTIWLLPKGRSAAQEVAELPAAIGRLFHVEQSLTDPEAGIVVGKGRPDVR